VAQAAAAFGLQRRLPDVLPVSDVAHAEGGWVGWAGAGIAVLDRHFAFFGLLQADVGAQAVGPGGAQRELAIPAQARAARIHFAAQVARGTGRQRVDTTRTQGIDIGGFFYLFGGEGVLLPAAGRKYQLAQQGVVAIALRVGCGAGAVGGLVGALVVECARTSGLHAAQPLPLCAGQAGQRQADAAAIVLGVGAQHQAATQGLAGLQQAFGAQREHRHHAAQAVGTVQGRGRAAHHFHALDQAHIVVVAAKGGRPQHAGDQFARHAHAIDGEQHPVALHAADVEAGVAVAPGGTQHGAEALRRPAHLDVGQVAHQFADVLRLGGVQCRAFEHVDALRHVAQFALGACAADHHGIQLRRRCATASGRRGCAAAGGWAGRTGACAGRALRPSQAAAQQAGQRDRVQQERGRGSGKLGHESVQWRVQRRKHWLARGTSGGDWLAEGGEVRQGRASGGASFGQDEFVLPRQAEAIDLPGVLDQQRALAGAELGKRPGALTRAGRGSTPVRGRVGEGRRLHGLIINTNANDSQVLLI